MVKSKRGRGRGGGKVLGSVFAGYVPLFFQIPYPIIVYSVPRLYTPSSSLLRLVNLVNLKYKPNIE